MIAKYIKDLLFEQDCVVIPDFGGFIANYVSADIHPIRHTFTPPSKSIAFNEMLRLNDGLLASYVAHQERISKEEALGRITAFIHSLRDEIKAKSKYRFEEVGTLFLNQEQKLQFEPDNKVNYLNDSFGLPELMYKPIDRNPSTFVRAKPKDRPAMSSDENYREEESLPYEHEENEPERSSKLWLIVMVPAVLLLAACAGYFLYFDNGNTALSSLNPFTFVQSKSSYHAEEADAQADKAIAEANSMEPIPTNEENQVTVQKEANTSAEKHNENWQPATTSTNDPSEWSKTEAPTVVAEEKKMPEAQPEETTRKVTSSIKVEIRADEGIAIPTEAARYYIIVGAFANKSNAFKLRKQLSRKGNTDAKVIIPNRDVNTHKVSYADFATSEEAQSKLDEIKGEFGAGAWIFKYVK